MCAGRPKRPITEAQREEILQRAGHRRQGGRRIAKAMGLTHWQVRGVLERSRAGKRPARLSDWRAWTDPEKQHLREHAGERGPKRLARDLTKMGRTRSPNGVRRQLLRMSMSIAELRTELTVRLVCELIGRSEPFVLRAIGRKELGARQSEGAWRIWPSELRVYVLADRSRVDQRRVELWDELVGLLAGEWGVSEDGRKRKSKGAA